MEDKPTSSSSAYPVSVNITYPTSQSRLIALLSIPFFLVRIVLLIPQIIVLYFLQIAGFIAAWLNFFVILFTGKSSGGLIKFVGGTLRWSTRVNAYLFGITDTYPPFKLDN